VLSTLHTNSAAESVARLVDMGIDPSISPMRCWGAGAAADAAPLPRCRRSEPAGESEIHALAEEYCAGTALRVPDVEAEWRRKYGVEGAIRSRRPWAAADAAASGIAGRLALYELLVASPPSSASPCSGEPPNNCARKRWPKACARSSRTGSRRCCRADHHRAGACGERLTAMREPFEIEGHCIEVSASVGVALL
jgi:hypothetical protein